MDRPQVGGLETREVIPTVPVIQGIDDVVSAFVVFTTMQYGTGYLPVVKLFVQCLSKTYSSEPTPIGFVTQQAFLALVNSLCAQNLLTYSLASDSIRAPLPLPLELRRDQGLDQTAINSSLLKIIQGNPCLLSRSLTNLP
jgi:hypothetical protein